MPFVFPKKKYRRSAETIPSFDITISGRIKFNSVAAKDILSTIINKSQNVALGYNEDTNEIAIVALNSETLDKIGTPLTFRVLDINKGKERSIPAKHFFDRVHISIPHNGWHGTPRIQSDEELGKYVVLQLIDEKVE